MEPRSTADLVLVRHAHRNTADRDADNGLSAEGRRQAKAIREYWLKAFGREKRPLLLLSSPKRRCIETLEPIADRSGTDVLIWSGLTEQTRDEGPSQFKKRVSTVLQEIEKLRQKKKRSLVLCCSHGDWLPEASYRLVGYRAELAKGGCAELLHGRKGWSLRSILEPARFF